jgi:integrase
MRAHLDRGKDPKQILQHEHEARSISVADAVELYIQRHCKQNQRSWKETQRVLSNDLVRHHGGMALLDIEQKHLVQLLDKVTDRGSPYAANALHRQMRAFFNWCEGRSMVEITPMRKIKTPHRIVQRHRVLSLDEISALYGAGHQLPYPWGPWLVLLILTGQRKRSVATLRWADIDPALETWTIPSESAKNAKPLEVPLPTQATQLLRSLPRHSVWVLSSKSEKPIYSNGGKSKRMFDESSAVSDWRIHDIRRSVATHLSAEGVDRLTIERILGHTDPSVTAIYERYDRLKERRNALQLWANKVERAASAIRSDPPGRKCL